MTTSLAMTRPEPVMDHQSLKTLMDQAIRYVESGLLPNSIKTPQQALIVMAQGRELGIPPTVALRGIVVVQGKPTCSAELMMALVHRAYGQSAMRVFKTDNESCTVQYRQQGWDGISEYTFSMEDARRANLLKNPTWNQYPAAMLRARAISATVRFAFPEVISGVYTPDEVGANFSIVDGEVVPSPEPEASPPHDNPTPPRDNDIPEWVARYHRSWAQEAARAAEIGAEIPTKSEPSEGSKACSEAFKRLQANIKAKEREALEAQLREVTAIVNDTAGVEYLDIPEDLAEKTDDQILEMIAGAQALIPTETAA